MEELLKEILAEVKSIKERMISMEERMTSMEERMTSMEERMTSMEERMASMEERMTATENEVKGLYAYIDQTVNTAIDKATKEISNEIQELSTRMSRWNLSLEKDIREISKKLDKHIELNRIDHDIYEAQINKLQALVS